MLPLSLVENGKLIELYNENDSVNRIEGNIYVGIVKDIVPGMQSAFIDIGEEKNSFIHVKDIVPKVDEKVQKQNENIEISNLIKSNDKILVQVKKDSTDKKGARISTHINLTGKYLVYMPNTSIITISQKIEDENEKQRLYNIVKNNLPKGNGAIIRTSAEGKDEDKIIEDIERANNKWNEIKGKYDKSADKKAKMIYRSEGLIEKILIDLFEKINQIIVDNEIDYKEISEIMKQEGITNIKIELNKSDDIFNKYDIEKQIEKIKDRKIWLKCGGFITIDKTEALTAIDVNTGKFTGKKSLEDTVYKVNEEATIEIAKQLKLRDIGGIIIIDYIDMQKEDNKEKIEDLLKQCLKKDRAKTQVEGFTKLDLMELTRKHICAS